MNYNVSPFINAMKKDNANYDVWVKRFHKFFESENCDPVIHDEWYNHLLNNLDEVSRMLGLGYLIDPYSALASFDDHSIEEKNSFNVAYYIHRNYNDFIRKNVLTVVGDYGVTNLQLQLCGVKVVSSIMEKELIVGAMLTAIMNECMPYPINHYEFPTHDIVIACSVFDDDERAWHNWQSLLDQKGMGKEVYFSTNLFCSLKKFINYDIVQLLELPQEIYETKDLEDLRFGYTHKLYKLK